jgi:hypothetical protein
MSTEKLESGKWTEYKKYTPDNESASFGFHFKQKCVDYDKGKIYSIARWFDNKSPEAGTEIVLLLDLKDEKDWDMLWIDRGEDNSPQRKGVADEHCAIYENDNTESILHTEKNVFFNFKSKVWGTDGGEEDANKGHTLYRFRGKAMVFDIQGK